MPSNTLYAVYLTIYTGNKLPPFYIGSGELNKIQTKTYFGSVSSKEYRKIWKSELKINSHLFKSKIISIHSTREEAYTNEKRIQLALNVVENSLYINKCVAYSALGTWNKGKKYSTEHRKAMSISQQKRQEHYGPPTLGKILPKWTVNRRDKVIATRLANKVNLKKVRQQNGTNKLHQETKNKMSSAAKQRPKMSCVCCKRVMVAQAINIHYDRLHKDIS